MSTLTTDLFPARTAAIAAAVGFLTIAAFQLALALGAPLGRAAWGGTHLQLPDRPSCRKRVRIRVLGAGRTDHPGTRRDPTLPTAHRPPPVGNPDSDRRACPRRGPELRLPQRLGALPVGTGRVDPGRSMPAGRAQRSHPIRRLTTSSTAEDRLRWSPVTGGDQQGLSPLAAATEPTPVSAGPRGWCSRLGPHGLFADSRIRGCRRRRRSSRDSLVPMRSWTRRPADSYPRRWGKRGGILWSMVPYRCGHGPPTERNDRGCGSGGATLTGSWTPMRRCGHPRLRS
jgi:hypothetical protein